jgi:ubiquinone/menaquinone biosynthesis C-methylase UbiE
MSQTKRADMLQEWRESAPYWAKYSETIREMFMPLTEALIENTGITQGQEVLDVAGGPGEPSLTIAETVGATGSVTCTDGVAEMVSAARREAHRRGLSNVKFHQCTGDSLPFADSSFDVAVSRLGAMFFPDPLAALREMMRVLKPGGVLGFVVWYKSELNPFSYIVTDVMARHVESEPADPDALGAFRFAELGKLAAILKDAGATDIRERIHKIDLAAPIGPEEFWEMRSWTSETLRAKLVKLTTEEREQIAKEVLQASAEYFPENQMRFPAQMLIVSGKKPE